MYDQQLEIRNMINISKLENRQTNLIEVTLYQILEILNLPGLKISSLRLKLVGMLLSRLDSIYENYSINQISIRRIVRR